MEKNRGSSFSQQEDELLCQVYLEISQDPIVSNNQAMRKLWGKIEKVTMNKKLRVGRVEAVDLYKVG